MSELPLHESASRHHLHTSVTRHAGTQITRPPAVLSHAMATCMLSMMSPAMVWNHFCSSSRLAPLRQHPMLSGPDSATTRAHHLEYSQPASLMLCRRE